MLRTAIATLPTPRRSRIIAWMLRLGAVVSIGLGTGFAVWGAGRPDLPGWATLLAFTGALAVGLLTAQACIDGARLADQHRRDLVAADLFHAIRTGRPVPPFILYLRPFASTDAIAHQHIRAIPVGQTGLVVDADRLEFEGEIEAALRGTAPLVALGRPLEHIGAGRIAVPDSHWKAAIEALMRAAALILLLPSPRTGTLWEIDQLIAGGHLARTLILDPPDHGSTRADYDPEAEWRAMQTAFARRGYGLPDDSRTGLVLRFHPGRAAPEQVRHGLDGTHALGAIVRQTLAKTAAGQAG